MKDGFDSRKPHLVYLEDIAIGIFTAELAYYQPDAFIYVVNEPRKRGYFPRVWYFDEPRRNYCIIYFKYRVCG